MGKSGYFQTFNTNLAGCRDYERNHSSTVVDGVKPLNKDRTMSKQGSRLKRILTFLLAASALFGQDLPEGFIVWSEGRSEERTIMMAKLSASGLLDSAFIAVTKGVSGGDIQSVISHDGNWLAFSRSLGGQNPLSRRGADDWADFDQWEVYVARLDGAFPATPLKVGPGYMPIWANDSHQAKKTLYYMNYENRTVRKVSIGPNGILPGTEAVQGELPVIIGSSVITGDAQIAPNGKFAALRTNSIYLYFFDDWMGQKAGSKYMAATGGYMPSITADSRWVLCAPSNVIRVGKSGMPLNNAGAIHYGTSQDLNWLVSRTRADARTQNAGDGINISRVQIKGGEAKQHFDDPADFASSDFSPAGIPLSGIIGSWPDIHVGPQIKVSTIKFRPIKIPMVHSPTRLFDIAGRKLPNASLFNPEHSPLSRSHSGVYIILRRE